MRVDDNTKSIKWQSRHTRLGNLRFFLRYNGGVPWIYLSPHFDDVALSCGGLVWEQTKSSEDVSIWTVCAGKPPAGEISPFALELHTRWEVNQNASAQRRIEDKNSCRRLGARSRYFSIPDCIYRRHPRTGEFLYASEAALNGPLHPGDTKVIHTLQEVLKRSLHPDVVLVCPLGLGTHVDHQLTRLAVEGLGRTVWYYADFPYVLHRKALVKQMEQEGWISQVFPVSQEGLVAWQDSISAHGSQISTFWKNELAMRQAVVKYLHWYDGIRLWRMPAS
jgi:LmbE family N-acetylglucosaminyl deacetylase